MKIRDILMKLVNPVGAAISREIQELRNENRDLRQKLYDQLPESEIVDFFVRDHFGALLEVEGGILRIFAELLVKEFIDTGAINYVEMAFTSNSLDPGERYVLTLQKASGLTPHQKLLQAQRELNEALSWKNW